MPFSQPVVSQITNPATTVVNQVVKATPGVLYTCAASNQSAATQYVRLYDKATAATGSDHPVITLQLLTGASLTLPCGDYGIAFTAGIVVAITANALDTDVSTPLTLAFGVKVLATYV